MAYPETPRTEADATYMRNDLNIENVSLENTLLSPTKHKNGGLIDQMRAGRGISLKTPRVRVPFADRRNLPSASRGEFTPLLQSVARKSLQRNGKLSGAPETPAFLKASYRGDDSPALPGVDQSGVHGSDLGSSMLGDGDGTPIPQVTSSSSQSTPLAVLPKRDAARVLADQGNVMTLREQENIISKIEKENFGLKLKIHFLEESLRKAGPGFNEAALRENTDLKVDKITIQKELMKLKRSLTQAERDVEAYKQHVVDLQEKAKRKHADESLRQELEGLRAELAAKDSEVKDLRQKLDAAESGGEDIQTLKDNIEDLEADLREKYRSIDERDDEIDRLKIQEKKDADEFEQVCNELEVVKERAEELEKGQGDAAEQGTKLESLQSELDEALQAKEKAEEDLDELRDEMSNKSINTKGLSRQLEDKANKLQDDLASLREKHVGLEERFNDKSREVSKLQEKLREAEQDADVQCQRLKDQSELLHHEHDATVRKCESLTTKAEQAVKELQSKSEEKDLLHSRHDALTAESQALQKGLSKAQSRVQELEESLQDERQHAQDNDRQLRNEAKREIDRLSEEIDSLNRELEDKESQFAAAQDHWESQRRGLQSQKEKAEEQAAGLQRTISKLQESEGTLSGRELKLQEALESEKQRHRSEEAVLDRRIQELNSDIDEKRQALDDLRSGISQSREELRVSQRDQFSLEEKVQALEDEIDVLQSGLDEEADKARERINAVEQEVEVLQSELVNAKKQLSHTQDAQDAQDKQATQELNSQLSSRLRSTEEQLRQAKSEKQSLQDKLAKINLNVHTLQTSSAEIEAERDEIKSQLMQMQNQVDETYKLDQEKLGLRTSKLRLENDIGRLREERKGLLEKNAATERRLEEEIERASSEEGRLNEEIADLQRELTTAFGSKDRELALAKQKMQRLEARIEELQNLLSHEMQGEAAAELSMIQKDLSKAQQKETECLQREAVQKEVVRDLKQKVARLERQSHELQVARLTVDSPKSSVGGSARKNEIAEMQRQLTDAHQQLRDARAKAKDDVKALQRRLAESERLVQANADAYEQRREQLEAELSATRQDQESLLAKNNTANQTITRLRTRISSLEKDIHAHRQATTADNTIAEERKDLHEMLMDAKLTAEDLQVQINARKSQLAASSVREKDLRAQLRRVREERTIQTQRSTALSTELDNLQSRYERTVDNLARQQRKWEEERKAMASRVRFANTSISELHANDNQELIKRHAGELRGLAKQIQWLRAKCVREEGFRSGLVYEKKFLLMQIEMFEACNSIDLNLLSEMGITPGGKASPRVRLADSLRGKVSKQERKRPSLRTVGFAVMATCRMKKMSLDWAGQKKVREALGKKLEGMVEGRKGKRVSVGR